MSNWPEHLHYPDCPYRKWNDLRKSGMFRGSPSAPDCNCYQRITDWLKKSGQMSSQEEKTYMTEERMKEMQLPDVELVSAAVHKAWMEGKLARGITTRKAEDGEELMVPYEQLSEPQKDQDRQTVLAVYKAISSLV